MRKRLRDFWRLARRYGLQGIIAGFKTTFQRSGLIEINLPNHYPIFLRAKTSDIDAFFQVLVYEDFNVQMSERPSFLLDLGANIGLFAIKLKALFPEIRIACVEPDTQNFEVLQLNTQALDDIHNYQKAIWHKQEKLFINDNEGGNWGKTVHKEQVNPAAETVETITIDQILDDLNEKRIDILKMDIEGAEKELFEADNKKWLEKVGILIVELHDRKKAGATRAVFKAICERDFYYPYQQENLIFKF